MYKFLCSLMIEDLEDFKQTHDISCKKVFEQESWKKWKVDNKKCEESKNIKRLKDWEFLDI